MKILLTVLILSSQAFGQDISFEKETEMFENEISGRVTLYCANRVENFSCYASGLVGGNTSRLYVKNGSIDADYVKLQRVGSKKIKGSKFYPKKGRSKGSFNLWIRSLLQRPLLVRGDNTIKYRFFKKKKLVLEGSFDITVTSNERRDCGWGTVRARTNPCPMQQNACLEFFRYRNYCR